MRIVFLSLFTQDLLSLFQYVWSVAQDRISWEHEIGDDVPFRAESEANRMSENIAKLDGVETQTNEFESEATLDTSVDTKGASDQQLWMYAEISELVEFNFETLVEKNLDYDASFLRGAIKEHMGSSSPFDDAMETALYRLHTRSGDKRERFEQQVFGDGDDLVNEDAKETALDNANYWLLMAWTLEHGEEHINMLMDDLEPVEAVKFDEDKEEYEEGTGIAYASSLGEEI